MKPLTEWTTDELRGELYDCGSQFDEALAELLRREREAMKERCAAALEAFDNVQYPASCRKPAFALSDLIRVVRGLQ